MSAVKLTALISMFIALGAHAEVYLTKDEALDLVLGSECEMKYERRKLDASLLEQLDELGLANEELTEANFFICSKDGAVSGYALIDSEVGKHLPITYIVGISPEGKVSRVEMMVFREKIGWEAKARSFMQQFEGKDPNDKLKLGSPIRHVTGATISSRSVTKGVNRALFLWNHFYGQTKTAN